VITVNNTVNNVDQQLAYFTEDVGLNYFYLLYHGYYPSWFNETEYGQKIDRRSEQFYYVNQQIYKRYTLQRMSHGIPDVQPFVYNKPLQVLVNVCVHLSTTVLQRIRQ
jgi:hypothetical protein